MLICLQRSNITSWDPGGSPRTVDFVFIFFSVLSKRTVSLLQNRLLATVEPAADQVSALQLTAKPEKAS